MADVKISELPAGSAVAAADVFVANQSGVTKRVTAAQLGAGVGGAVPTQFAYAAAIPLTHSGGHMAAHAVAAAITFTAAGGAVDGATCALKITADGTNTPNFSAFTKVGAGAWVNSAATVNVVQFFRVGGTNYYSVAQAA
jgi:hypothetical protein